MPVQLVVPSHILLNDQFVLDNITHLKEIGLYSPYIYSSVHKDLYERYSKNTQDKEIQNLVISKIKERGSFNIRLPSGSKFAHHFIDRHSDDISILANPHDFRCLLLECHDDKKAQSIIKNCFNNNCYNIAFSFFYSLYSKGLLGKISKENRIIMSKKLCPTLFGQSTKMALNYIDPQGLIQEELMAILENLISEIRYQSTFLKFYNAVEDKERAFKTLDRNNLLKAEFFTKEDYEQDRLKIIKHIVKTPTSGNRIKFRVHITKEDLNSIPPAMRFKFLHFWGKSFYRPYMVSMDPLSEEDLEQLLFSVAIKKNAQVNSFIKRYSHRLNRR